MYYWLLLIIVYIGTFAFAISGSLKARTHRMDIFGAAVLSFLNAYGGGTIIDILCGIKPINWIDDYIALVIVVVSILIVYFLDRNIVKFKKLIFITDAIGLGFFTISGLKISLDYNISIPYSIIMGVITTTFGGVLIDVLSGNIPTLLKKSEIYATACIIGGIIYVLLMKLGLNDNINLLLSVLIIVMIRIFSKIKNITLPYI